MAHGGLSGFRCGCRVALSTVDKRHVPAGTGQQSSRAGKAAICNKLFWADCGPGLVVSGRLYGGVER